MTKMEHASRYLSAVEKKNKVFFTTNRLKITDCVVVSNLGNSVNVDIIHQSLPASIKDDIKAMFWI